MHISGLVSLLVIQIGFRDAFFSQLAQNYNRYIQGYSCKAFHRWINTPCLTDFDMEMSMGVSLLRTAQSLLTGRTIVLARYSMSYNGQLWRPEGINPLRFSSTKIIVGLCLLIKTSTWPLLREQDPIEASHNSQYCRPQAMEYSFSPRTIPHWDHLAPTVVAAETTEECRTLI